MIAVDPVLQTVINIGAVSTAIVALIGLPLAFVKLWPIIKRWVGIGVALETLPERLKQQDESLAGITDAVNVAVKQVQNSHVTNLRDDVDSLKSGLTDLGKAVQAIHGQLDTHLQKTVPAAVININPGENP